MKFPTFVFSVDKAPREWSKRKNDCGEDGKIVKLRIVCGKAKLDLPYWAVDPKEISHKEVSAVLRAELKSDGSYGPAIRALFGIAPEGACADCETPKKARKRAA